MRTFYDNIIITQTNICNIGINVRSVTLVETAKNSTDIGIIGSLLGLRLLFTMQPIPYLDHLYPFVAFSMLVSVSVNETKFVLKHLLMPILVKT